MSIEPLNTSNRIPSIPLKPPLGLERLYHSAYNSGLIGDLFRRSYFRDADVCHRPSMAQWTCTHDLEGTRKDEAVHMAKDRSHGRAGSNHPFRTLSGVRNRWIEDRRTTLHGNNTNSHDEFIAASLIDILLLVHYIRKTPSPREAEEMGFFAFMGHPS